MSRGDDPHQRLLSARWTRRTLLGTAIGTPAGLAVGGTPRAVARQDEERAATQAMVRRPFAPADINLLNPVVYPDATPMEPASGREPSEGEARSILDDSFADGLPRASERRRDALAVFDDPVAIAKIPSPSLRVGLAALVGTFAEPAIDVILHGTTASGSPLFSSALFFELPGRGDEVPVLVSEDLSTGEAFIQFNALHALEHPLLFARWFVHEPLHHDYAGDDSLNGVHEEATGNALDTLFYLQQIARLPDLARTGTELSRFHNTNAMTRLNSGRGSKLGLYATNDDAPLLPGSPTVTWTSYWDRFANNPPEAFRITPGNAYLDALMAGIGAESPGEFSRKTLDAIDAAENGPMSATDLIAAAEALRLDTGAG